MSPFAWFATRVSFGWSGLHAAAVMTVVASVMIIVTGGVVRVTGSGLGCPTWPTCAGQAMTPTPEMGIHGAIEFGNRMLTGVLCVAVGVLIVVARCQREPDRAVLRAAWWQFWIVVLNAIVGGVTVLARLSPYVVAAHFVAAMLLLTAAAHTVELVARRDETRSAKVAGRQVALRARWLVAATAALVLLGTVVTGSGVHAGDSSEVHRMPFDWTVIVAAHGILATITLILGISVWIGARMADTRRTAARARVFVMLVVAQGAVGSLQALSADAEPFVVVHMLGAALIWAGALRVLYAETASPSPRMNVAHTDAPRSHNHESAITSGSTPDSV